MTNRSLQSKDKKDLAVEIAKNFGEENRLFVYEYVFQSIPEAIIKKAYEEALSVPDEKIRKTRSALFFYLLNKYAEK